tara:strand:- start:1103 stop:1543 length:441 start_codon:yes stop_codon:yes gene_type:complete
MAKTQEWLPFQIDRPVFVRTTNLINYRGKNFKQGQEVKWKELGLPQKAIETHYNQRLLKHDAELESAVVLVGDGLEVLDATGLHSLVDDYNERIDLVCNSKKMFDNRKMKKSLVVDKQRGLIRSWRRTQEDWLRKAEEATSAAKKD